MEHTKWGVASLALPAPRAQGQIRVMTTRRDFLATLGAGLGMMSQRERVLPLLFGASDQLRRIGIQLYTVRSLMEKDFEGTLAQIATIGYAEVEFAGYFGRTPARVREILKTHGLSSPSTHIGLPKDDDAWKRTLDDAHQIGHEWVTIAWLDAAMRKTPDDWKHAAERFNQLGAMARASGLRFAYHNHDFELAPFDGTDGLETLLKGTDAAVVDFEMDIYWVVKGHAEPLDLLARHPGRFA